MDILKLIDKMRDVQRLAGRPIHKPYSLMEHCYYVGMLFKHFASKCDVPYSMEVFDLVLKHDLVEVVTGDLVYPVKNFSKETQDAWDLIERALAESYGLEKYANDALKNAMTKGQYELFKLCDILDLYIFVLREKSLGNNTEEIEIVIGNCHKIINGILEKGGKNLKPFEDYYKSLK